MAPRSPQQSAVLPVIPQPVGSVLLPGIIQRIPVTADRPDIPALLSTVFAQASSGSPDQRIEHVPVVCVPVASTLLSPTGQHLLDNGDPKPAKKDQTPVKGELFGFGVACSISRITGRGTGDFALLVEGKTRVRIDKIIQELPHYGARVTYVPDEVDQTNLQLRSQFARLKQLSRDLIVVLRLSAYLPQSTSSLSPIHAARLDRVIMKMELHDAGILADFMADMVDATFEERLQVLAAVDVKERLDKVILLLVRQVGGIRNKIKVMTFTPSPLPGDLEIDPRHAPKNDRLVIRNPFVFPGSGPSNITSSAAGGSGAGCEDDREENDVEELQKRIKEAQLSPEAAKVAERELRRLKKMMPAQADYQVTRNYIENLTEIPWTVVTNDQLDKDTLARARRQLNEDHYGLDKVKERLVQYLAVLRLKHMQNEDVEQQIKQAEQEIVDLEINKEEKAADNVRPPDAEDRIKAGTAKLDVLRSKRMVDRSPILLLVGPPGVGKTSLAKSIATALGRRFHRISLGGVHDEAEIRGHRRTYVAAMPGLIMQGLKKVGVANPVFLLDELDKVGTSNFHGDPSAALLEVLDPEQNHTFVDHYVNIPLDLSKVLFIATANTLDTIPAPLLDRMETIYLPGYTTLEKRHIAMQHLIPKQVRVNGLSEDQVSFSEEVVSKIIESYTRESGVRNLEREIGSVCRAKAVEFADAKDEGHVDTYSPRLTVDAIEDILGIVKFEEEIAEKSNRPGVVTGLVAYSFGGTGSILFIEVADMPGTGTVQLTGKLGDVLKESVEVALTWVKAHAFELGLTKDPAENIMRDRSIHVHCPSGAIPKDGPSSGIGQAIALVSLFSGRPVPPTMAMTGEISLRGRVTAVGGIKEKLIGALRAGVKTVLLPAQNRKDIKDLPDEVKNGLEIIHVSHIWEAIQHVWPNVRWAGERPAVTVESRL